MGKGLEFMATAVITGGSKGIGKEIVKVFVQAGFRIVTCARSAEDLEMLKSDVQGEIKTFVADLSNKNGRKAFCKELEGEPIDVLVNNTGVFLPGQILEEQEGVLEKSIETNLYSAYDVIRAVAPGMAKQGSGHIFNICSTASTMPYMNGSTYCISKFAMLGMSKVLREELKEQNVRVTSVMPGPTYTASWEGADIPEERFMPASDIAKVVFDTYKLSKNTVVEEIVLRPQLGDL